MQAVGESQDGERQSAQGLLCRMALGRPVQWLEGPEIPPGFALSGLWQRLGPEALSPKQVGPARQLGVSCTGSQGWASSPAPAALPLPCLPGANTRTFMASQKDPWGSQSGF